jgi:Domain of unknown function (DUF4440)
MSSRTRILPGLLFLALAGFAASTEAQTWTPEQQEIWKLEELQWKMNMDKDVSWIDKMVHPSISVWEAGRPAPQNKASITRWNRYSNASSTVLEQEIFPIAATITGNVAVVQYSYTMVREDAKKDREMVTGHWTDVLIKEGGRWMFIGWAGGDDPKK